MSTAFNLIDGILPNMVHAVAPKLMGTDAAGAPRRIPGLGFIVFISIALIVGYISPSFIVSGWWSLPKVCWNVRPGIKFIYGAVKDFFEAFAGNKRKFTKSVLVSVGEQDVWQVGFITQEELREFDLQDMWRCTFRNPMLLRDTCIL